MVASVVLIALALHPMAGFASHISLSDSHRLKLIEFAASDPGAKKLFQNLTREADAALNAKANPISKLGTAGRLDRDALKVRSRASLEDMKKVYALGYAYAVTSRPNYSTASRRIILQWAKVNGPTGVPIDETKLEPLFIAYDLTRSTFSQEERTLADSWLRTMAALELQSAQTKSVTRMNNWNSHRLKIVGLIGFLLEDKPLIEQAVQGFKKQIELNLDADGSSFDFRQRDALHYHCYDLEPLLGLALVAQLNGIDLFNFEAPSGACLRKALDFLVPFCDGTKTHAEWVHSKVKFDRERAEAGEHGFTPGAPFDPSQAQRVFELAAFFQEQYQPLARRLSGSSGVECPTWQCLLNKVRKAESP